MRCTLDSDGDGYPDVALTDSPVCSDPEGTQEIFCIQVLVCNTLSAPSKPPLAVAMVLWEQDSGTFFKAQVACSKCIVGKKLGNFLYV